MIAVVFSVGIALVFLTLAERMQWLHFFFQIPLVIPHLVVAITIVFLLSPTGLLSRVAQLLGLIKTSSEFPLLINDRFGIGIMRERAEGIGAELEIRSTLGEGTEVVAVWEGEGEP